MAPIEKPLVVITCTPFSGHINPIGRIGAYLVTAGYDVTFVTITARRAWVLNQGMKFFPVVEDLDIDEETCLKKMDEMGRLEVPVATRLFWDIENIFLPTLVPWYHSLQNALQYLQTTAPSQEVVHINESWCLAAVPLALNTPGIKASSTIGVGIIPVVIESIDTGPLGPDSSPHGRARNKAIYEAVVKPLFANSEKLFRDTLSCLGAGPSPYSLIDCHYRLPDIFLQTCLEELEYPRSDLPPGFEYVGILPKPAAGVWNEVPSWWHEDVVINAEKKKIVFVCQGTVARVHTELLMPTLRGLAERLDVLVIAALGLKDSALPDDLASQVPTNARVIDFIPYEHILPYSSVFVTNAGYGGFMQAVSWGIPIVAAGISEDKVEVTARIEWSGCGVNLKCQTPEDAAVADAVETVLADPKYKKRLTELMMKAQNSDPFGRVVHAIEKTSRVPLESASRL